MRYFFLIVGMLALASLSLSAQPIRKAQYDVLVEHAAELYAKHDYYNALQKYEEAFEDKRDHENLTEPIANLHYLLNDYRRAENWLGRLLSRDKEGKYAHYRFLHGRVLKMTGQYDEAIPTLQQFIAETDNDSLRQLAQAELLGAEYAIDLPKTTQGVTLENLGRKVNSGQSEYSPSMVNDELYFSKFNQDKVIVVDNPDGGEDFFAAIYRTTKGDKGWDKAERLDEKVNRPNFHTSHVSLSKDGRRMFYTRSQLEGNVLSSSEIYMSEKTADGWTSGNRLEGVNGTYMSKQPRVGELFGKEVLFFVANRPGGFGGFDIYYAPYESEGVYGDPVNLGRAINTLGDDEAPFYRDGTLYFSSTGHPGLGGFDIFYSTWDGRNWSAPENMGRGYNTKENDLYFSLNEEGYKGFLASNREGGRSAHSRTCCNDLYEFEIARLYADLVVGLFTDGREPLVGGTVNLANIVGNTVNPVNKLLREKSNRFDFDLELDQPYRIIATHPDYYPDTFTFNTLDLTESKTFEHRFYLKAKPVPPREPEFDTITIEEAYVLENILYDFDSDRIRSEAEPDLQAIYDLMVKHPEMRIELSSHTDIRGEDRYNETLSQRRAESARRWLIRKGIDRSRMDAKGYGENVPQIVSESHAARYPFLEAGQQLTETYINTLATEEQREQAHFINRRTEFKIVEGPTSITIKRVRVKETSQQAPDRNNLPTQPSQKVPVDTVRISEMSSLYTREATGGVPIMHLDTRVVDFGLVKKGEQRTYTYYFVNKGDVPLEIALISACDCTTTEYDTEPVAPGEEGAIKIIFDSKDKDFAEVIDVDVILNNLVPENENPIIERLQYKFDIEQ